MAKRTPGVEGSHAPTTSLPIEEQVSSRNPRIESELLDSASLEMLLSARKQLQALLKRVRPIDVPEDRARALFVRGELHFPDDTKFANEVLREIAEAIERVRGELSALEVLAFQRIYDERVNGIIDAQRARREAFLADPIPRLELPSTSAPKEEFDTYFDAAANFRVYGRSTHMFSRTEDRIPGFDEKSPYIDAPIAPEARAQLWEDGLVVDPERMPPRLWVPYNYKKGEGELARLEKRALQIPTLKGMLSEATPLGTPKGGRTRVLVTHGTHGGLDVEGCFLVTKERANAKEDTDGPQLVAYMSRNIYRVQRERTHLVEGVREEADAFQKLELEGMELHGELPGWKKYANEEKDELRGRVVDFLQRTNKTLGAPARRNLQGVQELLEKILRLLNNPGAMMASLLKIQGVLGEIIKISRQRHATVSVEKDALRDEITRFQDLRARGISWTSRLFAHPKYSRLSPEMFAQQLHSLVALVDQYGSVLQPFAAMSADVRRIAVSAIAVAEAKQKGWRAAFTKHALVLDTTFRSQLLAEGIENVLGDLSAKSNTRAFSAEVASEKLENAFASLDAIIDAASEWPVMQPGRITRGTSAIRHAARDTVGTLANIAVEAREEEDVVEAAKFLRRGLKGFDAIEQNDVVADAGHTQLKLARPVSPGRDALKDAYIPK